MAEHPVIACYRGPDSVGALQLAAALATELDEPLVLAVAYAYEPVALSAVQVPSAIDERRADAAEEAVQRARRLLAAGDVRERVVAAEDVAVGLSDLARETDACLLVLGRDAGGHVARDVVARAACPVAISPFDVAVPGAAPLSAVAVADDGSPSAALARRVAAALACAVGTTAATLTVGDRDDPARELIRASDAYDVLVCGSRGRGAVTRALLGSVSSRLVAAARCAVVVVGPASGADPGGPLGVTTAGAER